MHPSSVVRWLINADFVRSFVFVLYSLRPVMCSHSRRMTNLHYSLFEVIIARSQRRFVFSAIAGYPPQRERHEKTKIKIEFWRRSACVISNDWHDTHTISQNNAYELFLFHFIYFLEFAECLWFARNWQLFFICCRVNARKIPSKAHWHCLMCGVTQI